MWTEAERNYLDGQGLGRLVTLAPAGPQVRPVGFQLNTKLGTVDIGGIHLSATRKWRNIQIDDRVAFVVDDTGAADAFTPRGVEIRGHAETIHEPGELIRITPRRIISWGLDTDSFTPAARNLDTAG